MSNHPNPEVSAVHHARLLPILSALVFPPPSSSPPPSVPPSLSARPPKQPNAVGLSLPLTPISGAAAAAGMAPRPRPPTTAAAAADRWTQSPSVAPLARSLGRPVEPSAGTRSFGSATETAAGSSCLGVASSRRAPAAVVGDAAADACVVVVGEGRKVLRFRRLPAPCVRWLLVP